MDRTHTGRHAFVLEYQCKLNETWHKQSIVVLGTGPKNAKDHLVKMLDEVFESDTDYEIYHGLADFTDSPSLHQQTTENGLFRFNEQSKTQYNTFKELLKIAKLTPAKSVIAFSR